MNIPTLLVLAATLLGTAGCYLGPREFGREGYREAPQREHFEEHRGPEGFRPPG